MSGTAIQALIAGIPAYGMILVAMGATLFPGVPEEAFLLVIGYMVGTGSAPFGVTAFFLVVGFLVIDSILFALARRDLQVFRLLQRRIFGITDIDPDGFIATHLDRIVFGSRFAFYIRWIGPVLAGRLRMPWKRFLLIDLVALALYVPAMLVVGVYFRSRINALVAGVNAVGNIVGIVIVCLLVIGLIGWASQRFKKRLRNGARSQEKKTNTEAVE